VTTGNGHSCAVTADGGVKCWGDNSHGQLGDGTTSTRPTPVDVVGLAQGAVAVEAGWDSSCALLDSGEVKCWGDNSQGQLGDGTTTDRLTPVSVIGLTESARSLAMGWYHSCVVTVGGVVKCWGSNGDGQLGDGSRTGSYAPVSVVGLSGGVSRVTAGGNHTCALTSSEIVLCWGNNWAGQIGDGTTLDRLTPVTVSGLSGGTRDVACDGYHTCAVTASGAVKCWGSNEHGQLGDGASPRFVPTDVQGFEEFAVLHVNHSTAAPGSYLTLTGSGFPPGGIGTLSVNGTTLTNSLVIDSGGKTVFLFITAGAELGHYNVKVSSASLSAATRFVLAPDAPFWSQEDAGPIFSLPAGIAYDKAIFLPLLVR